MQHSSTGETPGGTTRFLIDIDAVNLKNFEFKNVFLDIDGISFRVITIEMISQDD